MIQYFKMKEDGTMSDIIKATVDGKEVESRIVTKEEINEFNATVNKEAFDGLSNAIADLNAQRSEQQIMNTLGTGRKIRAARKAVRMTQSETAKAIGMSLRNYQAYEGGAVSPPIRRLRQIAEALNCTIEDLIGDGESSTPHEPAADVLQKAPDQQNIDMEEMDGASVSDQSLFAAIAKFAKLEADSQAMVTNLIDMLYQKQQKATGDDQDAT